MALQLESKGEFSRENVGEGYDIPSRDEWNKVEVICKLTDRAYDIAKALFETKYPTANIYLYNLQDLRVYLAQESMSSCTFTSNVAKKMLMTLDKYWKSVFMVLGIASVMDPRHKMKYIEYLSLKCEGSDANLQTGLILDAIHNLYDGYVKNDIAKECSISISNSTGSRNPSWLQEYNQFIKIDGQSLKSDLDWYLEEPVVPWSEDFNALKWWRAESPKYPTLSKMARDFLAIPMTVVTSYDAYSTKPRVARLDLLGKGKELQNALMCTRSRLLHKWGKE